MIDLANELLAPEEPQKAALRAVNPAEAPVPDTGEPRTGPFAAPSPKRTRPVLRTSVDIDRPYGERGEFEKITVTLPSDVRALLLDESNQRKKRRSADWPITAIVREALASYLSKKGG